MLSMVVASFRPFLAGTAILSSIESLKVDEPMRERHFFSRKKSTRESLACENDVGEDAATSALEFDNFLT